MSFQHFVSLFTPSLDHGGMKITQTGFGTIFSATGASGTNNFATTA